MTAGTSFRCSVAAEVRGDPMVGTAPPQTRVLIVHQPGAWGPRGLIESRCDPEVARRIDAAASAHGMRLQATRRPGKHEPGVPAGGYDVGIADTKPGAAKITWWRVDDLAEIVQELEGGWPRLAPVAVDTEPLYLVCAHGKHDPCCALRGRPIARAIQQLRPGRVWETTHLGGDRFAANVLVLPTGELYGRVTQQLAPELVRCAEAGEIIPTQLRGRIGLSAVAQAALIFAYQQLGICERDALNVRSVHRIDEEHAEVTIVAPHGQLIVAVESEVREGAQLTCRGPENVRAREYRGVSISQAAIESSEP
ncbi:MAG TPA: sucrase ferredoxin [Candidatus Tumulicola sp.]